MQRSFNTHYDIPKLTLFGTPPAEGEPTPRMVLAFRDGVPRFKVYLGKDKGIVDYGMEHKVFGVIIKSLKRVAEGEYGCKESHPSYKSVWKDNKVVPGEKKIGPTLIFGRSKEGICYVCMRDPIKGNIVFPVTQNIWHEHNGSDQEKRKEADISSDMTMFFAECAENIVFDYLTEYAKDAAEFGEYKPMIIEPYDPDKPRQGKFNNNVSKPAPATAANTAPLDTVYDDDIPF